MKRFLILAAAFLLLGTFAFADDVDFVTFDGSAGLHYNALPLQSEGGFQILEALLYMRGGVHGSIDFNINDMFSAGVEAGILYMTFTVNGTPVNFMDFPVRGSLGIHLGDAVSLEPFGGVIFNTILADGFAYGMWPEAGARVVLGSLYIEGSYVWAKTPYPRFGIGTSVSTR